MKRNSLYLFTLLAAVAGYVWVAWNHVHHTDISACLFKSATGLPCPSCGTTRSILLLYRMDMHGATYNNPMGLIMGIALCIFPVWILYDIITKKSSFYNFYRTTEIILRTRWVAIPLILLVAANWLWNIYKYAL